MPHELSISEGRAEMMYVGDTPWHGLGTRLDRPATALEAIQAAHLDWTVHGAPVGLRTHSGYQDIDGYQAIHRTDTGEVFAVLSDQYQTVQNADAWSVMDSILGTGQAHYHTAGALRGGRVVWILAQLGGAVEVVQGDPVENYLLLVSSHDGSLALQIHTTPIRVVCSNTMTAALGRGRQHLALKHTLRVHRRLADIPTVLARGEAYFGAMIEEARRFARQPMGEAEMAAFSAALMRPSDAVTGRKIHVRTEQAEQRMNELFVAGRGQDNPRVRGTAWAAFNAVTEYLDYCSYVVPGHGFTAQGSLQAQDRRLHRTWFGSGPRIRDTAWRLLLGHRRLGVEAFQPSAPRRAAGATALQRDGASEVWA